MVSASVHQYLTYAWIRDEEWMGYTYPSEVRRFLDDYGQWEDCKVFSLGSHPSEPSFYLEVPRDQWLERFGVEG